MTGLIWTIQVVHYPIFDAVDAAPAADGTPIGWQRFAGRHTRTISYVVGPFMVVEGVTGIWLALDPPGSGNEALSLVALVLMGVCYGTTAFVSAPLHGQLAARYDVALHRRLMRTNMIRTIGWTLRAVVLTAIAFRVLT